MSAVDLTSRPRDTHTLVRGVAAAAVVALVAVILVQRELVQTAEAEMAYRWISPLLGLPGSSWRNVLFFTFRAEGTYGFRISDGCSVVVLVVPILLFGASMLALGRAGGGRWIASLVAGCGIVVVVDQLRLGLIVWSTQHWGIDVGFQVTHVFAGSVIAILGFALAIVVMVRIMTGRRGDPHRRS